MPQSRGRAIPPTTKGALNSAWLGQLQQPFDIAGHDQAKIFDIELQMTLGVFDDLLDLPVHRVEGMIRAVKNAVGSRPGNRFAEKRQAGDARAGHVDVFAFFGELDDIARHIR